MSGRPMRRGDASPSRNHRFSRSLGPQRSKKEEPDLPFFKEDQYTDTVLIVGDKKLYINKCILGYVSTHFQKLLDDANKIATAEKKSRAEIRIKDKSYQDFVDLLTYLHPATSSDISETTALRLLPLATEYGIHFLKIKCEKVLVSSLRKYPVSPRQSTESLNSTNRRDSAPEILLKCLKSADASASKPLLEECVKLFSDPEIPIKSLRSSTDVSHQVKAKIYENRLDNTSVKMSVIEGELEREKLDNELLKKQMQDRRSIRNPRSKINSMNRSGSESSLEKDSLSVSTPRLHPQLHHRTAHSRNNEDDYGKGKNIRKL